MKVRCPHCGFDYDLDAKKSAPKSVGKGSQNNHAWGHATEIGKEIGEDGRDVLYECCKMAAPDYPTRMNAWGEVVPKRWSLATVKEASVVIEKLHQLAAERGVILWEDKCEDT